MNTSSELQSDSTGSTAVIKPSPVEAVEIAALTLGGFVTTAIFYVMVFVCSLQLLAPVVTILSGGEVLLGRMDAGGYSALWSLPVVLLGYSLFLTRTTPNGRTHLLLALWGVWTAITFALAYIGFLSVTHFIILAIANAVALALGNFIGSLLPAPRSKKPKIRTDLQWLGFFGLQALVILPLGFCALFGFVCCISYANQYADQIGFVGKLAPAVCLETVDGGTWTLEEHKGKVVLLEFEDRGSRFDEISMLALSQISNKFGGRSDFVMASVAGRKWWNDKDDSSSEQQECDWPLLTVDRHQSKGFQRGSSSNQQKTFLIDRDGVVRSVFHGDFLVGEDSSLDAEALANFETEIEELLK